MKSLSILYQILVSILVKEILYYTHLVIPLWSPFSQMCVFFRLHYNVPLID